MDSDTKLCSETIREDLNEAESIGADRRLDCLEDALCSLRKTAIESKGLPSSTEALLDEVDRCIGRAAEEHTRAMRIIGKVLEGMERQAA